MDWNLKKTTLGFVTSLLAFTAVHAKETTPQKKGILNPPVQPYANEGIGFFVDGELLLWKARETGLDYATKAFVQALPTETFARDPGLSDVVVLNGEFVTNVDGRVKTPEFNWNFGFQFGLGWNPSTDGWDMLLQWTHMHSTASGKTEANPLVGQIIIPEFQAFIINNQNLTYTEANSHWKLNFNTIDLEIGRQFLVSKRLSLRPFVGLRAAWIQQRYEINSQGNDSAFFATQGAITGPYQADFFSQTNLKNNFSGLGPRVGLNTDWLIAGGLSIYGEMGFALMLGHFKSDFTAVSDVFPLGFTTDNDDNIILGRAPNSELTAQSSLSNSFRATRASTDLGLGLRWRHKFYEDRYSLAVQVGWDQHYFFDQNQFITFVDDHNTTNGFLVSSDDPSPLVAQFTSDELQAKTQRRGDLSLQGFNFSIRLDF